MRRAVLVGVGMMLALPATAAATTYTVTTPADSGSGSLRDAINHALNGDKIVVPPGMYNLSSALPAINHDVSIAGAGAGTTTVAANQTTFGVFTINAATTVTISGLTITGGRVSGSTAQGGGILTSGNLTLNGVVVTGNKVESTSGGNPTGGGIEVASGNLSVNGSQVTGNVAQTDAGGGSPQGGGIDDSGGNLVTISNSQISSNTVSGAGGGASNPLGGGIKVGSPGTLEVSTSQITQNTITASGFGNIASGGGVAAEGSAVVTVTGSTVSANTASGSSSAGVSGGGVYSSGPTLAISATTVVANDALSASGGSSLAGGILQNGGSIDLSASTVSSNTATLTGGSSTGGGLYVNFAPGSIVNSTITGNSVSGTSSSGGGVYSNPSTNQAVSVLNSTIDGNSAGHAGGDFYTNAGSSTFENTIVSAGSATTGPNCSGPGANTSQGHNIESGTDCGFTASGDHQNTDPKLGPLQDNGGPTQTQAVQPLSPIIAAGNTADCPATDQRGVLRPQGPACDIGALEVELPAVATGAASGISQTAATLNGTVSSNTLKATPASYHFEWGTTSAYGNSTPTASGSGTVSASLSGLAPNTTYHFRLVATNTDGGSATGGDQTFTTKSNVPRPRLIGVGETHRVFAVGAAITPITKAAPDNRIPVSNAPIAKHHPKGTVFTFALNVAATVKIKVLAQKPGRLVGHKCKPATRRLKHRPPCTRSVPVVTLTRTGVPGLNLVAFSGRLPHRKLAPGGYQVVLTATNSSGTSGPQALAFTIAKQ